MDIRETLEMVNALNRSNVLLRRAAKKYGGVTIVMTDDDEMVSVYLGKDINKYIGGKSTTIVKALVDAIHTLEKSQDLHTL